MATRTLEDGELFFFSRPRVEHEIVAVLDDVQHLYFVLAPRSGRRRFRLFVVGRKRLPDVRPRAAHAEERGWALNVMTTEDAAELRKELGAQRYTTTTRGERRVAAAVPVGEARYALVWREDHAELGYVLERPRAPGSAQGLFGIRREATYVASVKNDGRRETPRAWIGIDDPVLLDPEGSQLLLVGIDDRRAERREASPR